MNLDATYVKAHEGPRVVSKAIVIATGVARTGDREVLGLSCRRQRGRRLLDRLPALLRARGLTGVKLVISDSH